MTRSLVVLLALGLSACAAPNGLPPFAGRFTLESDAGGAAPPPVAVAVADRPGSAGPPAPAAPAAPNGPIAAPAPSGGGGASAPAAPRAAGTVQDLAGAPLAGVTIAGAAEAITTDAEGRFAGPVATDAALLTASKPGYIAQTQGPPYAFALVPAVPLAGASYTLEGDVVPAVDGALVTFADDNGVVARALTAGGHFTLTIAALAGAPADGLLVVTQGVAWPDAARYRLLQAAAPLAGAITTDGTPRTDLVVSLAPVTQQLALASPAVPAGLRAAGVELSVVSPKGTSVPVNWSTGPWPATLPVPQFPGLRTTVRLAAQDTEDTLSSTAEHVVPAAEAAWAPSLLAPPGVVVEADGTVRWPAGAAAASLSLASHPHVPAKWEGVVKGSSHRLPDVPPGGELTVRVWDVADAPLPSRPKGPKGDRRSASRRVVLP